jgi:hypothetical protein
MHPPRPVNTLDGPASAADTWEQQPVQEQEQQQQWRDGSNGGRQIPASSTVQDLNPKALSSKCASTKHMHATLAAPPPL